MPTGGEKDGDKDEVRIEFLLLDFVEAGEGFLWFVSRLRSTQLPGTYQVLALGAACATRSARPVFDDDVRGAAFRKESRATTTAKAGL